MKPKILISTSSFGKTGRQPLELLEAFGAEVVLNPYGRKLKPQETMELLADIDGLVAGTEQLSREVLAQAPRLQVISRCGTGLDSVDLEAAAERQIPVYNTPDAHVDAVAELTLAGILDVLRHVPLADQRVRQGAWKKPMGRLLRGKTVGVVGLGRIGKALVQLMQPFAVNVLAYDPVEDPAFAAEYGVTYLPLDTLLGQVDILTLHMPAGAANHHLIDERRLGLMQEGAILVNCARGGVVDENALLAALQNGRLSGAYLDTFEQEPYQGPLAGLDNVLLTPHIGSYAAECRLQMETEAVENLLRFFRENS